MFDSCRISFDDTDHILINLDLSLAGYFAWYETAFSGTAHDADGCFSNVWWNGVDGLYRVHTARPIGAAHILCRPVV